MIVSRLAQALRLMPALALIGALTGCEGPALGSGSDTGPGGGSAGALTLGELPAELGELSNYFSSYVSVFGVHVVASAGVTDEKALHAAQVMAEYLDNDEDGEVDDPVVLAEMLEQGAMLVMFATESELESSGIFESTAPDSYAIQDLYGSETHPEGSSAQGGFDATLEEVLHLINHAGHSVVYPESFGLEAGSALTDAMDLARGGHFQQVPAQYPDEAWYHYDDTTCDYGCMAIEYLYWALTSILGAQSYPGRCEDIAVEWEPCTPELVEQMDPAIFELLTGGSHILPTQLPDGIYSPG